MVFLTKIRVIWLTIRKMTNQPNLEKVAVLIGIFLSESATSELRGMRKCYSRNINTLILSDTQH